MNPTYFVLVCSLVVVLANSAPHIGAPAINHNIIARVNADPKSTWVAGENQRLKGMSVTDFTRLLGWKKSDFKLPEKETEIVAALPDSFDARTQWPGCVGPVLDQGHCGSCWAFGTVEAFQDRTCIQSNSNTTIPMSEAMMRSCDTDADGCEGGDPGTAWEFIVKHGIVTAECYPYDMGSCGSEPMNLTYCDFWNTPKCNKTCQNGDKFDNYLHFASKAYSVSSKPEDIQSEIMQHGPVTVAFDVYEDLALYQSGVYSHQHGSYLGGHVVKIIGWGVSSDNVDYWIVQNSWSPNWGMNGYFWIQRGVDECGIEDEVVAGLAKV